MQTKKWTFSLLSLVLVLSLVLTSISAVLATEIIETAEDETQKQGILENAKDNEKIHDSIDISEIRNEGGNPPELLSKASSLASADKQWYEYIRYCTEPIGICQVNNNSRIVFHDPYDYGNSLIMEIDDSITDWSSSNSLTATYETGNTVTIENQIVYETYTGVEVAAGADHTTDVSTTKTQGRVDTYNNSKSKEVSEDSSTSVGGGSTSFTEYGSWSVDATLGSETTLGSDLLGFEETIKLEDTVSKNYGTDTTKTYVDPATTVGFGVTTGETTDTGYSVAKDEGTTTSNVTTVVADRISTSTGQNITETQSWSTSDSHSISKTYEASYFNSSGSPLQWKIVKYKVIMPLLYKTQYLIDGEWVTASSGYCTLTTIQGTCRSWLENNTAYYEHWGTGEPVTWNEFWGTFFTKEKLIEAYKTKLYPEQIRSVSAE